MASAICLNFEQSYILSSGKAVHTTNLKLVLLSFVSSPSVENW